MSQDELYGVPTKRLNEQVKRNQERFPPTSCSSSPPPKKEVVANRGHFANLKFSKTLPHAFTEHGAKIIRRVRADDSRLKMRPNNLLDNAYIAEEYKQEKLSVLSRTFHANKKKGPRQIDASL